MSIKITKDNRWHDKPYQPQFNVDVDEVIEVSNETIVIGERADCVSHEMAKIMVDSGNASFIEVEKPADKPKDEEPKSEDSKKDETDKDDSKKDDPVKETKPDNTKKETKPKKDNKVETKK